MGKYSKPISVQRKVITGVCIGLGAVLVLVIAVLLLLNGNEQQVDDTAAGMKELLVQSVTEQDDTMIVETTYGTVRYPFAFSDIMYVEAETFENHAELDFCAMIDGTIHKVYTLLFNGEEGMPVGTLQNDGETYVVTVQFHDISGVSEENIATFYAAQETFNDAVNSLSENKSFTATD